MFANLKKSRLVTCIRVFIQTPSGIQKDTLRICANSKKISEKTINIDSIMQPIKSLLLASKNKLFTKLTLNQNRLLAVCLLFNGNSEATHSRQKENGTGIPPLSRLLPYAAMIIPQNKIKTGCAKTLIKMSFKDDFQSAVRTLEKLFAFFVLFHVRHHNL